MIATASTGATARPAAAEDVTVAAVSASHALRSRESGDGDRASMDERAAGDAAAATTSAAAATSRKRKSTCTDDDDHNCHVSEAPHLRTTEIIDYNTIMSTIGTYDSDLEMFDFNYQFRPEYKLSRPLTAPLKFIGSFSKCMYNPLHFLPRMDDILIHFHTPRSISVRSPIS
jgi:hypothetical protein